MSSSKVATFFVVALLLLVTLSSASRPLPEATTLNKTQMGQPTFQGIDEKDENCKGVGEEECLMRRTLAAHLDYIYTQKENKP